MDFLEMIGLTESDYDLADLPDPNTLADGYVQNSKLNSGDFETQPSPQTSVTSDGGEDSWEEWMEKEMDIFSPRSPQNILASPSTSSALSSPNSVALTYVTPVPQTNSPVPSPHSDLQDSMAPVGNADEQLLEYLMSFVPENFEIVDDKADESVQLGGMSPTIHEATTPSSSVVEDITVYDATTSPAPSVVEGSDLECTIPPAPVSTIDRNLLASLMDVDQPNVCEDNIGLSSQIEVCPPETKADNYIDAQDLMQQTKMMHSYATVLVESPPHTSTILTSSPKEDQIPIIQILAADDDSIELQAVEVDLSDVASETDSVVNLQTTTDESDADWAPAHSSHKKPYSQRGRRKLNRPLATVERKARKKEQNKNAATRYRVKKQEELKDLKKEEAELEKKNKQLKEKVGGLATEIKYLKNLMRDILKARGHPIP